MSIQYHDGNKWTDAYPRPPLRRPVVGAGDIYYDATKFGVSSEAEDNTPAMQALIDLVAGRGGGVIWMPTGVYRFDAEHSSIALTDNVQTLLTAKSGVSIVGESITGTIIQVYGDTTYGVAWMSSLDTNVTVGCVYHNFTVDMSGESMVTYTHKGKAFYLSGVKDCVFRDLRLLNTPSTSLGIDMLDNVVIDSVYIYRGGREWIYGGAGGAGIGIGTGKWRNENYIIRNCICDSCGHFGIFLEDQGLFGAQPTRNYSKGQIIANNVVRNGRHYGIGIRGGKNIVVNGNNIYENHGGVYLDFGAKNVLISGNIVAESAEAAVLFGEEDIRAGFETFACENVVVAGNSFFGNNADVLTPREPINCRFDSNYTFDNGAGAPARIVLSGDDMIPGIKLMPDGSEAAEINALSTDYLDVSAMGAVIRITTTGVTDTARIAQYDSNKNALESDTGMKGVITEQTQGTTELTIEKVDGCAYMRIFYTPYNSVDAAIIQSIVIEGA